MKIMKKVICLLLALLMLIAVVPETALPVAAASVVESGTCGENLTWKIDSDGVLTVSGEGSMMNIYPWQQEAWMGKAFSAVVVEEGITTIGEYAFSDRADLTSVTLPSSLGAIGSSAFSGCKSLKSIKIPESVTGIGRYAFSGCEKLTSVVLPDTLTSVQDGVFEGCKSLKSVVLSKNLERISCNMFSGCSALSSVKIPAHVIIVDSYAFYECTSLTSIVLPEGLNSVQYGAFYGCTDLTSVTVSKSVESISSDAFLECTALKELKVDANNDRYVFEDGILYNKTKTEVILSCPKGVPESLTLPETVETIGSQAFSGCSGLTSVKIPASVTTLAGNAFTGCTALKKITVDADNEQYISIDGIVYKRDLTELACFPAGKSGSVKLPDTLTSIPDNAFADCSKLTSITIPESVRFIGGNAFVNCTGLTSLTIPDSVTSIYYAAFSGCSNLTSVTLPKNLEGIDSSMFSGCTKLSSVTIPEAVEYIEDRAFRNCTSLTSITIPANVQFVGAGAFLGCSGLEKIKVAKGNTVYSAADGILYDKAKQRLIFCPANQTGAVEIPDSVTSIGWDAFYNCSDLTAISIPNSVKEIGACAFGGCTGLKSISIPNSVTRLAYGAFRYCSNLGSVQLPESIRSIDYVTFEDCTSLKKITIPKNISYIGGRAFDSAGLEKIVFEGDAPSCDFPFVKVKATAYYPEENETWTKTARNCLGSDATITWKGYASGETPWITELKIKTEPKTQYTELGEKATFTVKAVGDGLKYQWYYKDVDGSKYKKCSGTKATYSLEMTEARKDRKLYCVITDEYGNEVKSKTVYMRMAASIKTEPKTQYTQLGDKAKFTVKAVGDDLKYQWYYKDADGTKYKKCSGTKATYSLEMTEARKDRKLYCVITDKYGNEVKSKTVYMRMAASIKTEPKSVTTSIGKKAKFTVKAAGDGLTYQWYYKDTDGKKYKKASCTKATYSIELTKARNGRKFYCVVTDKYGNEVKTKTVSMKKK